MIDEREKEILFHNNIKNFCETLCITTSAIDNVMVIGDE